VADRGGPREPPEGRSLTAWGDRSVVVGGDNTGVVQTGDYAYARVLTGPVSLGSPQAVDAPSGGLLGRPRSAVQVFVGRDDELDELDRMVQAGSGVVTQTVHGLGGVGKTELALQYATRHWPHYRLVWWVVAENRETIEAGLAELAFRLHPDVMVIATQAEAANWAIAWLQSHAGWLLVLDNVEHRRDVEPLLGQLINGHVLMTTRRDVGWENVTNGCLRLDVLNPAAAVTLLTRLSNQVDPDTAKVLAEELGYLPLAVQQAGAYMSQAHTPMATYLQRLRDDPAHVLATVADDDDAQRAVARTWSVTIDRIAKQAPLAVRLLHILSCFASDALPRDVLTAIAPAFDIDSALGTLASYNMITLTNRTVTVHRLVQVITANQLRRPSPNALPTRYDPGPGELGIAHDWNETLRAAVDILRTSVPSGNPQDEMAEWPRWTALNSHVAALASLCSDNVGGQDLAGLLSRSAAFDRTQGSYRQALVHGKRALAITEAALGPSHPGLASVLSDVGAVLGILGRVAEAEPLLRRALAITETGLGPDHPDVARRLNNLALSLRHLGRPAEAEPLQDRALAITEAAFGPNDARMTPMLSNLAVTLRVLGRVDEAESLQRRAVAIAESTFGPDHPHVAMCLDNLAYTLMELGRPDEAEPLRRRALAITEAAFDPDHPDVAMCLDNLAYTLLKLRRADEAEPLLRRALAIVEPALGPDHPHVAAFLDSLAAALADLGRAAEAEPLLRRAQEIRQYAD
jgi:tetratricopeptide (TPR) repeat protein